VPHERTRDIKAALEEIRRELVEARGLLAALARPREER
jgi:hypothetical protein